MSFPDSHLNEPEELDCRECYDREHAPRPVDILVNQLDMMDLDHAAIKTHARAAFGTAWWPGFKAWLAAAYEETVPDRKWSTCSRCAGEARADAAEPM